MFEINRAVATSHWRIANGKTMIAALTICVFACGLVRAQAPAPAQTAPKYVELPLDPQFANPQSRSTYDGEARVALSRRAPLDQIRPAVDRFYNSILFREMTQLDKLNDLPNKRLRISQDMQTSARSPEVHAYLTDKVYRAMRMFLGVDKLSSGGTLNVHPGVRVNAMLILGSLNSDEGNPGQQQPPTPMPEALDVMLAALQNQNEIEAVKLAAVVGILRHVQLAAGSIPQDRARTIAGLMLDTVNTTEPPAGRPPEYHAWLQRRALDILAAFRHAGPNAAHVLAAYNLLASETTPMSVRITAAQSLGNFDYSTAGNFNAVEAAQKLGALAVLASRDEVNRVEEELKDQKKQGSSYGGGMMMDMGAGMMDDMAEMMMSGGMGMGMMGGTGGVSGTEARKMALIRRRLKYQLNCVLTGLGTPLDPQAVGRNFGQQAKATGVVSATQDEGDVDQIKKIIDAVNALMTLTDEETTTDPAKPPTVRNVDTLLAEVRRETVNLENLVPAAMPAEEPVPEIPAIAPPAPPTGAPVNVPGPSQPVSTNN